ncbi:MAG: SDR family oxidoreductase [Ornithinimicrobium sp.]
MSPQRPERVAVVTGAGSGIGRAVAQALLQDGYAVGLLGRRVSHLQQTLEDSAADATRGLTLTTDVTNEHQVSAAFDAVLTAWGRVDLLFNNAGTFGPAGPPDSLEPGAWRQTVEVNLTGSFLCAQQAFAIMRDQTPQGGRIINNGSISAHTPRPGAAAYTATKHALTGLTKSLALDGRDHRIAVGQIDIGNTATELTEMMSDARQADGSRRSEPTFDVQHVADMVLAMARLPLDVSIPAMTMIATGMPYHGRG